MLKKYIFITFLFINICISYGQIKIEKIAPVAIEYKKIDTISLKLHVYYPIGFDSTKVYNAIVFFHGGGWNKGSYKAFQRQSRYLASRRNDCDFSRLQIV